MDSGGLGGFHRIGALWRVCHSGVDCRQERFSLRKLPVPSRGSITDEVSHGPGQV